MTKQNNRDLPIDEANARIELLDSQVAKITGVNPPRRRAFIANIDTAAEELDRLDAQLLNPGIAQPTPRRVTAPSSSCRGLARSIEAALVKAGKIPAQVKTYSSTVTGLQRAINANQQKTKK